MTKITATTKPLRLLLAAGTDDTTAWQASVMKDVDCGLAAELESKMASASTTVALQT